MVVLWDVNEVLLACGYFLHSTILNDVECVYIEPCNLPTSHLGQCFSTPFVFEIRRTDDVIGYASVITSGKLT